jgi:glutathione S-transferase
MSRPTLYHVPPSFYSQIARLALAEKGVDWEDRITAPGPPTFETYQPWYLRLNPGGTVPTMTHGDRALPDSMEIARYVDATFPGPALCLDDPAARAEMERWVERLGEVPIRDLSYGTGGSVRAGARVNSMRLRVLRRRGAANPSMADVYDAKIADIEGFRANALDPAHIAAVRARVEAILDEMDALLADRPWLAGADYSLADVVWTVGVARLMMLGLPPLEGRPSLARWYAAAKARPSFARADVWETFKVGAMVRVISRKFAPQLSLAASVLLALGLGLAWWI